MDRWHYAYWGLRVSSDLPIPEWSTFEVPEPFDHPDVAIRLEREAPPQNPTGDAGERYTHIAGSGTYHVRLGREITVTPTPRAEAHNVRLWLLGQIWAVLCYQRGLLMLHASVVEIAGSAVAFCGRSGSGKSTLAAWLAGAGGRLISDDLCRVELTEDGPPRVWPSTPRLKLWLDAVEALGWPKEGLVRDHIRLDKFHWTLQHANGRRPLPLRAICLLDWGELGIERLTGLAALTRRIATATYRADLLEPLSQVAAQWERGTDLARRVPIFELRRPRDWSSRPRVVELLQRDWGGTPTRSP